MTAHYPAGLRALFLVLFACAAGAAPEPAPVADSSLVLDLDLGETVSTALPDGTPVEAAVLEVLERRDTVRRVLRRAEARVRVNGETVTLVSGLYSLPVVAGGVRVDCPVTRGYLERSGDDHWKLEKDVRLRFWPGTGPLTEPGTFCYPLRQKWLASETWFDNEPVDGGAVVSDNPVYYHAGVDLGAMEGMTVALAAAESLVVSARGETLPGFLEDSPVRPRADVVYLRDGRGWFYRYSHFHTIDDTVLPGTVLPLGAPLGLTGKEGASGGWSHLHFEINRRQPGGGWGVFPAHALLREAYIRERTPEILACARVRHLLLPGESATLDGFGSWSAGGEITAHEWRFTDGSTAAGAVVTRVYPNPGSYSEILKVTDAAGRIDYDFALVQVVDPGTPGRYASSLHLVHEPTLGIRPGDPVTFAVRAFGFDEGAEEWDFGDGGAARTCSGKNPDQHAPDGYTRVVHRYTSPGSYIVRVGRTGAGGMPAFSHVHVVVGE